jgi:hypothetical protein
MFELPLSRIRYNKVTLRHIVRGAGSERLVQAGFPSGRFGLKADWGYIGLRALYRFKYKSFWHRIFGYAQDDDNYDFEFI